MQTLSQQSQQYLQKILKFYPMSHGNGKQNQSSEAKHKFPQQHSHDYRKERQIYDRPTSQKLESIKYFKQQGNNHYKNQRYQEASYFYQKAIIYGDYTFPDNQKQCDIMDQLLQQVNCNMGLSLIKVNEWDSARVHLIQGSKGNNSKVKAKALYWLTKFYVRVNQYEKAKETIQKISEMESPFNESTAELETLLRNTTETNTNKEKKVCENMFQK